MVYNYPTLHILPDGRQDKDLSFATPGDQVPMDGAILSALLAIDEVR